MESPCWVWTAGLHANGYGKFGRGAGSDVASRIAWELANGPIPEGLCALHRCDHRSCVRPDHLFLGTRLDNARDRVMKGRGRNGTTKLTREQVEHIRVIWSTGMVEMKAIGPAFGIHPAHVSGIIRNKFWKRSEAA